MRAGMPSARSSVASATANCWQEPVFGHVQELVQRVLALQGRNRVVVEELGVRTPQGLLDVDDLLVIGGRAGRPVFRDLGDPRVEVVGQLGPRVVVRRRGELQRRHVLRRRNHDPGPDGVLRAGLQTAVDERLATSAVPGQVAEAAVQHLHWRLGHRQRPLAWDVAHDRHRLGQALGPRRRRLVRLRQRVRGRTAGPRRTRPGSCWSTPRRRSGRGCTGASTRRGRPGPRTGCGSPGRRPAGRGSTRTGRASRCRSCWKGPRAGPNGTRAAGPARARPPRSPPGPPVASRGPRFSAGPFFELQSGPQRCTRRRPSDEHHRERGAKQEPARRSPAEKIILEDRVGEGQQTRWGEAGRAAGCWRGRRGRARRKTAAQIAVMAASISGGRAAAWGPPAPEGLLTHERRGSRLHEREASPIVGSPCQVVRGEDEGRAHEPSTIRIAGTRGWRAAGFGVPAPIASTKPRQGPTITHLQDGRRRPRTRGRRPRAVAVANSARRPPNAA